jgi:hypothetical protein
MYARLTNECKWKNNPSTPATSDEPSWSGAYDIDAKMRVTLKPPRSYDAIFAGLMLKL